MSRDPKAEAALALHRFGFGPRFGSIAEISADPRGAVVAEIEQPGAGRISDANLLPSDAALRADHEEALRLRAAKKAAMTAKPTSDQASSNMASSNITTTAQGEAKSPADRKPNAAALRLVRRQIISAETEAHIRAALDAKIGLAERLVWFWSNHFTIAIKSGAMSSVVGAFEREAIRPHILGKFSDMLLAVESHPAMLMYLDNARSFGPNSRIGLASGRGLNENLARETLELHTLGVRTVYDQTDVTNFSKVLTGWRIAPLRPGDDHGGQFEFRNQAHEPGPQTVVGKTYAQDGIDQGRAVLADLARHPATARHISTKLVVHFVADDPPKSIVDHLVTRFLETEGDLKEVTRALLRSDEAWNAPRTKLKRPSEWIVGAMRAVGADTSNMHMVTEAQNMLAEPLWRAPSPKGYSDQSSEWTDGVAERLDIATFFARRLTPPGRPTDVMDQALGPLASAATRSTISRAEDGTQALALLLMAPEFQMR